MCTTPRTGYLNIIMAPLDVFIPESVSLQWILFLIIRYKCISLAPCALQCKIKSEMSVMLHAAVVLEGEKTQPVRFKAWKKKEEMFSTTRKINNWNLL